MVQIDLCHDPGAWDSYAARAPQSTNYHRWAWREVIERAFGWPAFYFIARQNGDIAGILPLVWQKSRLFGSFLTSLPFFSYGGIVADDAEVEQALVDRAVELARELRAGHLELRNRFERPCGLLAGANKVSVVIDVEPDAERALKGLRHEVRTKIRKALKAGLVADMCGIEALDDFYEIFARNMRDLGTPVYGRAFFQEIMRAFPSEVSICVVKHQGKAIAASFVTEFRDTLETLWGSSLRSCLHLAPNMLMYWRMLRFAAERGLRTFDLGRSTVNSGPHLFKLQWSTRQQPLAWQYWVPEGRGLPQLGPGNSKYRFAIRLWQKLPVGVTKRIGPPIVRCLP